MPTPSHNLLIPPHPVRAGYQAAIPDGMRGRKDFAYSCKAAGKPSKRSNSISPAGGGLRGWNLLCSHRNFIPPPAPASGGDRKKQLLT